MYLTAPLALGVLKIDRPLAGGFLGLTALSGLRVVETAVAAVYSRLTAEKNKQPGFARGNAPLLPTAPPPEGEVCSMLNFYLIRYEPHFGD